MRYRVVLELATSREFPSGSSACGYEMILPLAADCRLDLAAWQRRRHGSPVRRFWHDQREQHGELRHDRDGWFLAFGHGEETDEAVFEPDHEPFVSGTGIAITECDGQTRLFRIVALVPEPQTPDRD
jgi:hypothetical protein